MAKVTITLEDGPVPEDGDAREHVEITIESDPPLPIAKITDPQWLELIDGDEDLDMDAATAAQVVARGAIGEMAGQMRAATIMVRKS